MTKSGVEEYYHYYYYYYYYYYYCDGKEESFSIEEFFSLQRILLFHGKFFNLPLPITNHNILERSVEMKLEDYIRKKN